MSRQMKKRGFTLIELVVTIVILGTGITGFLMLMNTTTVNSIDPMIRQQAHAVAQSYLEEILLNSFCDPDLSTNCPTFCTGPGAAVCSTCGGAASPAPPESRANFDDVCDYDVINDTTGARNQFDAPIATLSNFNVEVTVDDAGGLVGTLDPDLGEVVRVDVRVTHDNLPSIDITLSGYRTNFQ